MPSHDTRWPSLQMNFKLYPCQTERFGHSRNLPDRRLGISLRSKRFGRVFRTFETLLFFALPPIFKRPKSKKMLRNCGKTYGNACYAGYLGIIEGAMITTREEVANISHDPDIELSRPKFAKFKIKGSPSYSLLIRNSAVSRNALGFQSLAPGHSWPCLNNRDSATWGNVVL